MREGRGCEWDMHVWEEREEVECGEGGSVEGESVEWEGSVS